MAFTAPVPRPRSVAYATSRPLNDALTSPWVFAGSRPFHRPSPTPVASSPETFADDFRHRRSPRARPLFTRAATLFGALCASVFEARQRLSTSATQLTTCGHCDRSSRFLAGRGPQPPSVSDTPRCFLGSCGVWRAAQRPMTLAPVLVPPAFTGFPNRDTESSRHLRRLAPSK